jgi:hypothetical protein
MCFQWSREERKGVLDSLRPTNLVKDFGEVLFSILAVGSRSHLGIFAPLVPCFDRFQTLPPTPRAGTGTLDFHRVKVPIHAQIIERKAVISRENRQNWPNRLFATKMPAMTN